jgi:hypothetical protein
VADSPFRGLAGIIINMDEKDHLIVLMNAQPAGQSVVATGIVVAA